MRPSLVLDILEEMEQERIGELREFVIVAAQGSDYEWDRAYDTVAGWSLVFTRSGDCVAPSRATLRRAWEMYVALLCQAKA